MSHYIINDKRHAELDSLMQKGYEATENNNDVEASLIWLDLWKMIKETMDVYNLTCMEDMDEAFLGQQSVYNWATDFELALYNASLEDKSFLQSLIDFCREYITKSRITDEANNRGRKRAIAEAYFMQGNVQEGERRFKTFVEQYPGDAWGWINWSDQYAKTENRDTEKAIAILKSGLEVNGLRDRYDTLKRLEDLYTQSGLTDRANELRREADQQMKKDRHERMKILSKIDPEVTPVRPRKIGRNDPCPCGSGKKYKKCCGK